MAISGKRLGWPCLLCAVICLAVVTALPVQAQQPAPLAPTGFNGQAPALPVGGGGGAMPAYNAAFANLGPVGRVTSVQNPGARVTSVPTGTVTPYGTPGLTNIYGPPGLNNGMFDPTGGTYVPNVGGYGGYGGGGGYYPPYYSPWAPDYNAGFLRGTADILSAGGSLLIRQQQASLINQQVEAARLENHKRLWDQWLYERYNMPTLEDERKRWEKVDTERALNNPSTTEILQATTLNRLLNSLKGKTNGRPIPVDESVLKYINVVDPNGGNLGVLKPAKEGQPLNWPQPLKGEGYSDEVKQVNQRVAELLKQAEFKGEVDPGGLQNLKTAISRLKAKVQASQAELTLMQQIEAKRFLNQLDAAWFALGQPKAADLLTGKLAAKGKTVPELLNSMYGSGVQFAPATNGDEAAYVALYNSLLAYAQSVGLGASAGSSYPPPPPGQ
jgi:hypothetical protein